MFPSPENPAENAGRILLVEEYSALAAAFGALLRRAFPQHQTLVVPSVDQAESRLRHEAPALLVMDVDPPQQGAIGFLKRLKSAAPDLPVIIIGADDADELNTEPNGPRALRFIKKPFAVDEFSATARDLMQPRSAETGRTIRNLKLIDLLALEAIGEATKTLLVEAPDGRTGEIHFHNGRIVHALVVGETGVKALHEMLRWSAPRLREAERDPETPRTINLPWRVLLLEALRATHVSEAAAAPEPTETTVPPTPVAKKKILIIDDTETLLVFLEEVLSIAEPTAQIVTASSGLQGIAKAAAEKPDLILLDYSLPDINGDEVCRRLLSTEATARVPIIMMSGHVPEMVTTADEYENVIAAIAKPFISSALIELIEKTMVDLPAASARRRARAKAASAEKKKQAAKQPAPAPPREKRNGADEEPPSAPEPPPPPPPDPPPPPPTPTAGESTSSALPKPIPPPPPTPLQPPPYQLQAEPQPDLRVELHSPSPAQPRAEQHLSRAAMAPAEAKNAVVVTLPLEITSMQFSPALEMKAMRARPFSSVVSMHILPGAVTGAIVPEATFEMTEVKLTTRGQIDTMQVAPTHRVLPPIHTVHVVPLVGMAVLQAVGGPAMELMPAPAAPLRLQLTALFELVGVELAPGFRVGHLVLKSRGEKMRVTQEADAGRPGITIETAQVLLDRSSRIAEILLETVA